jgi:hypothetical protein
LPLLEVLDIVISTTYLYTRPKKGLKKQAILLTEVICAIGHSVRGSYKLKKDSALAAKTGAFFLYSFEQLGMIQVALGSGGNGHGQYVIQVIDDEAIAKLWEPVTTNKLQKLPSETPYAPWVSTRHETGAMLVKTNDKGVLFTLRPETHPIVFTCINTAQEVGWTINKKIFDLHSWALRNKTAAFAEIWELANPEAKTTKLREVKAIGDIAKRFLTKTFYH